MNPQEILKEFSPEDQEKIIACVKNYFSITSVLTVKDIDHWLKLKPKISVSIESLNELIPALGMVVDEANTDSYAKRGEVLTNWCHPDFITSVVVKHSIVKEKIVFEYKNTQVDYVLKCGYCRTMFFHNLNPNLLFAATSALSRSFGESYERVCIKCVAECDYPKCGNDYCHKYDIRARFRTQENQCSDCYRRYLEEHMFVNYNLTKQPVKKINPKNFLHTGCEIECYVNPTGNMKFNKKYVWSIKRDGSLSSVNKGHPIEIVTQPLLEGRGAGIRHICKELKRNNAVTDATCGGHIHVEARGLYLDYGENMTAVRNLFRIYEGAFFAVTAPIRLNSDFCYPVELDRDCENSRYMSLNFLSYEKYGTLEFRVFGGSVSAKKWLNRLELCEGFVKFAKKTLNLHEPGFKSNKTSVRNARVAENIAVYEKLIKDSGFENWGNLIDQYCEGGRSDYLRRVIKEKGEALISLAGIRFGLSDKTIIGLIKEHKLLWRKK